SDWSSDVCSSDLGPPAHSKTAPYLEWAGGPGLCNPLRGRSRRWLQRPGPSAPYLEWAGGPGLCNHLRDRPLLLLVQCLNHGLPQVRLQRGGNRQGLAPRNLPLQEPRRRLGNSSPNRRMRLMVRAVEERWTGTWHWTPFSKPYGRIG